MFCVLTFFQPRGKTAAVVGVSLEGTTVGATVELVVVSSLTVVVLDALSEVGAPDDVVFADPIDFSELHDAIDKASTPTAINVNLRDMTDPSQPGTRDHRSRGRPSSGANGTISRCSRP
jgi:hypothetical protein